MLDNAKAVNRISGWLYAAASLLFAATVGIWLYHSSYFPVRHIKIEGELRQSNRNSLQQAAQQYIQGNILSADLNSAQKAFASMPWIAEAHVRRRLPDTVEIDLIERIPVARLNEKALLDSKGNVFSAVYGGTLPTVNAPIGTEKQVVHHLAFFQSELAKQQLHIRTLTLTRRLAWILELENGLVVYLGRENEDKRLSRFVEWWPLLIRQQADKLAYVDMRYKDGFAVRNRSAETAATDGTPPPKDK